MPNFAVNDRRGTRASGLVVGQTVQEAKAAANQSRPSAEATVESGSDTLSNMGRRRRMSSLRKSALAGGAGGADVSMATARPRDPMFYWRQNNLPYDLTREDELKKIRKFCSLLYQTHPIIAGCIDIYSVWPLQGMELRCEKDSQIEDFYGSLFMDQLDYGNYLRDVSHQKWKLGEAFPLAAFNESLGVWESDELIHPDDVEVERSPFLKDPRFTIRLPEGIRQVLETQSPRWEYEELITEYPELHQYASQDALMPVSSMLMKQIAFKPDNFFQRGVPILMRAFRSVTQEEMLNAAMDSIADRLYTPLILAKLGASASDLGTDVPWVPTPDDLDDFLTNMDAAMAADFRVMVHHFATDIESVFGRETMPDLSKDFDRIESKILKAFGISDTMLNGADQGETYAADALHMDVLTDILTKHQQQIQRFFTDRALIVAEAQEHYDFEVRNGRRYVKMEEILEYDEETGEETIVEQPKLLVPTLEFETLSLRDAQVERQFIETLATAGVPISHKSRLRGTGLNMEHEREARMAEIVEEALDEQRTRKETFQALMKENLPKPEDLTEDFQAKVSQPQSQAGPSAPVVPLPGLGTEPQDLPVLAPTDQDLAQGADEQNSPAPQMAGGAGPGPYPPQLQGGENRLPESDEQRWTMPKR